MHNCLITEPTLLKRPNGSLSTRLKFNSCCKSIKMLRLRFILVSKLAVDGRSKKAPEHIYTAHAKCSHCVKLESHVYHRTSKRKCYQQCTATPIIKHACVLNHIGKTCHSNLGMGTIYFHSFQVNHQNDQKMDY